MKPKLQRTYRYYEILGLTKSATIANIRQAYRLIIRKYHPDINKDPEAAEIAKKINEAFQVLSESAKRLVYDNSEAECPKCWTHEVRPNQGNDRISYAWRCTHCGCSFTFCTREEREKKKSESTIEHEEYVCPRCRKPLIVDESLSLYRCHNQTCKGVFSKYELRKYYSKSIMRKQSKPKSGTKSTNEHTKQKEIKSFAFSTVETVVLKIILGISILITLGLTYYLIFSFSLLFLGLFIILLGFTILSLYIYKYPRIISVINSLIIIKYQNRKDE